MLVVPPGTRVVLPITKDDTVALASPLMALAKDGGVMFRVSVPVFSMV